MFRRGKLSFLSTKDDRIKIINERINQTERHLMEMCSAFALCTRKMAKYRDAYDELAKGVKIYADDEEINENLSAGLKTFTNTLTILGDYMDVNVHRMELKIVNELAQFEQLCKSTRDNLRLAVIARDKEVLKQRQMLELKSKFAANNTAADSELIKARAEVQRTNKEIDALIGNFEQRKLSDVKRYLSDFILISMKYHTKALEVFSANYYDVSNIDEQDDFMVFQRLMKTKEEQGITTNRKNMLKKGLRSQSMDSLDRKQLVSPLKRIGKLSRSNKNLATSGEKLETSESEEDDDDDDEIDEEQEELEEEEDDDDDDEIEKPEHAKSTTKHLGINTKNADSASESPSASDAESENNRNSNKPRENVFGAKTRHVNKSDLSNAATTSAISKPVRNPVKHPFKAVAATHIPPKPKPRTTMHNETKQLPIGIKRNAPPLTGGGINGGGSSSGAATVTAVGGRLVTVVESKRKSGATSQEQRQTASGVFKTLIFKQQQQQTE